jgi:butyrate kinase
VAKHILALNLGSTSTKVAYYVDEQCVVRQTLDHDVKELNKSHELFDQYDYRLSAIQKFIAEHNISIEKLDAVVSRGGNTKPLVSGAYQINDVMLEQLRDGRYGVHPANLGCFMAYEMCKENNGLACTVDPAVTDELQPLARLSGLPQLKRESKFHALNQKATAKRYAQDIGKDYNELNLIVVHMGGGVSVAAHKNGAVIDVNNSLEGDGPYAPGRAGGLPAKGLVDLCFSGEYKKDEIARMLTGKGGLTAYLGTADVREIEARIDAGDKEAEYYLQGMTYQIAKEIGAMSTVLRGKVDAILITGGIAYSQRVVNWVKGNVAFIADIILYPGEDEMEALALGTLRVLNGEEKLKLLED